MALTLKLRSGGLDPVPELSFDAPRIVIGRAAGSELQLPDPSVSSRHASVRQRGSGYVLIDEGSENGTFSGDVRLTRQAPHVLADGELLRFGRIWVEISIGPASVSADAAAASRGLARELVEHALKQDQKPYGLSVRLAGVRKASGVLRLDRARHSYRIGSGDDADLQLPDPELPARCLELQRHGDQVWVTRLRGCPEARFGDRELAGRERTLWPRGVELTLGEHTLKAEDATGQLLEHLEREPTELLNEDSIIDPPERGKDSPEPAPEPALAARASLPPDALTSTPPRSPEPFGRRARIPRADAVVFLLALGVLGLSLWAIRWLAHFGSA